MIVDFIFYRVNVYIRTGIQSSTDTVNVYEIFVQYVHAEHELVIRCFGRLHDSRINVTQWLNRKQKLEGHRDVNYPSKFSFGIITDSGRGTDTRGGNHPGAPKDED